MMLTRKGRQLGTFIGRLLALRDFHRVTVVFGKNAQPNLSAI